MGGGNSGQVKASNQMLSNQMQKEAGYGESTNAQAQKDIAEQKTNTGNLYSLASGGYAGLAGTDVSRPISNKDLDAARAGYQGFLGGAGGGVSSSGSGGGGGGGGAAAPAAEDATMAALRALSISGGDIRGERGNDPNFGLAENSYKNFMSTGGWDPTRTALVDKAAAGLMDIGQTGGISEIDKARARGGGVYDEFASTGGYNPADISNIRSRATSGIPAFYANMRNEANRMGNVQGGYGPGRAALMSRLGRQQSAGAADAALNAELGIKGAVNEGRLAGAGGMASSEAALQSLLSSNKLAGLTGGADVTTALQNSMNQGKQFGTSGIGGMAEADRAALMRAAEGRSNVQLGSLSSIAQIEAANRNLAASSASAAASRDLQARMFGTSGLESLGQSGREFAGGQQEFGLSGLTSLYNSKPEAYNAAMNFGLANRGATADNLSGMAGGIQQIDPWWKTGVNAVGGVAAGLAGNPKLFG